MEPHCYCHVRAVSYLLLTADNIFLCVSVARTEGGMSRVMDFAKRFEAATAYTSVNLRFLEKNKFLPVAVP